MKAKMVPFICFILVLLLVNCSKTNFTGDKNDDEETENASVPTDVTGAFLVCGKAHRDDANDTKYGCIFRTKEGEKFPSKIDKWEIFVKLGTDKEQQIEVYEIQNENGAWSVIFDLPQEFLDTNFIIEATAQVGSEKSEVFQGCPMGFINIPGSDYYGTSDFCVMKFEAREETTNGISKIVSKPEGKPRSGKLSRNNTKDMCKSMGEGFALILNKEWMTIGTNIVFMPENWADQIVGGGGLNRGNAFLTADVPMGRILESSKDDNQGCYQIKNVPAECDKESFYFKRTHRISNGEIIWDFSGNVREFVSTDNILSEDRPTPREDKVFVYADLQFSSSNLPKEDLVPTTKVLEEWDTAWEENFRSFIGKCYVGDYTLKDKSEIAITRGGDYTNADEAGVFQADLNNTPTYINDNIYVGFRCVFHK